MGVKNIWTLLEPAGQPVQLPSLYKKTLAVDASIWIYQFIRTTNQSYLLGFLRRICKLLFYGIRPIFVFDGQPPDLKKRVLHLRKERSTQINHSKLAHQLLHKKKVPQPNQDIYHLPEAQEYSNTNNDVRMPLLPEEMTKLQEYHYLSDLHMKSRIANYDYHIADPLEFSKMQIKQVEYRHSITDKLHDFTNINETKRLKGNRLKSYKLTSNIESMQWFDEINKDIPEMTSLGGDESNSNVSDSDEFEEANSGNLILEEFIEAEYPENLKDQSDKPAGPQLGTSAFPIEVLDSEEDFEPVEATHPFDEKEFLYSWQEFAPNSVAKIFGNDIFNNLIKMPNAMLEQKKIDCKKFSLSAFKEGYEYVFQFINAVQKLDNRKIAQDSVNNVIDLTKDTQLSQKTTFFKTPTTYKQEQKKLPPTSNIKELFRRQKVNIYVEKSNAKWKIDLNSPSLYVDKLEPLVSDAPEAQLNTSPRKKEAKTIDLPVNDNPIVFQDDKQYDLSTDNPVEFTIEEVERIKNAPTQPYKEFIQNQNVSSDMIQDVQELLTLFGIPYITAPQEAESQCAYLNQIGLVDGIVTEDADVLLFGGAKVYKNIFKNSPECYDINMLTKYLNLDQDKLIYLAHLLGSDYCLGVQKVGLVGAVELLLKYSDLEKYKQFNKDIMDVSYAYTKPVLDTSTTPFVFGEVQLDKLYPYLERRLKWDKDEVNKHLLPILERHPYQITLNPERQVLVKYKSLKLTKLMQKWVSQMSQ
eukprot:NODE_25_length_41203_cov_0.917113.p7 type:complete len:750 gc:universal NODE_25_length_41203_cov_0.917113:423-2672(+)